jgi:phospholipase C
MRRLSAVALVVATCLTLAASCGSSNGHAVAYQGIRKIRHIVVIMQENRSFDEYFGTYPGADGIPANVCVPDPKHHTCDRPYHDAADINGGGPHGAPDAATDIDGGKMDGFVAREENADLLVCTTPLDPNCGATGTPDVMGWHDAREIPNYWTYAHDFVLQDHMFQPDTSWSWPSHMFLVSGWAARCTSSAPSSCTNDDAWSSLRLPQINSAVDQHTPEVHLAWTDLTDLLHRHHVSWGYYILTGREPDCEDPEQTPCVQKPQNPKTPGQWNPLPLFDDVKHNGQLGHVQSMTNLYDQAKRGHLPAVSWVIPSNRASEHPPASVRAGQAFVTGIVNAIMSGPDWDSTAIFVSWDDWGGFYDHLRPPRVDENGYGLRVPGLLISPYARRGYIDHQTLSFDAYLKFIEDDFLNGARLNPKTDGRPDPRPTVREDAAILGDLSTEFDFSQTPRPPVIMSIHPEPGPASR